MKQNKTTEMKTNIKTLHPLLEGGKFYLPHLMAIDHRLPLENRQKDKGRV